MQEYLTRTERIQNYIKELLDDEKVHRTGEIAEYVDKRLSENGEYIFQLSSYVNAAMRILMENGEYAKVARGCYQKGGIPYTPATKEGFHPSKNTFLSTMSEVKSYAKDFYKLFSQKPPFPEMDTDEENSYSAIKKSSLDVAGMLKSNVDKVLGMVDSQKENSRDEAIRKYFKEFLSDGKQHKMNDIKDYVFSKMMENGEYRGERNTSYVHWAIRPIINDEGPYQKVARGVYQHRDAQEFSDRDSVYSASEMYTLLDKGFEFSEKNIRQVIISELTKKCIDDNGLAGEISENIESSIDNVSFLIAFADDYMNRREEMGQNQGITMSGI